jgi:hypothetical protein
MGHEQLRLERPDAAEDDARSVRDALKTERRSQRKASQNDK